MMNAIHDETKGNGSCDCCMVPDSSGIQGLEPYGCAERKAIFTYREQRVLKSIREISLKARDLKSGIKFLKEGGMQDETSRAEILSELERLRALRDELEKERLAAAHERMVLLGHA